MIHFDKADMALAANGVWSVSAYRENFYVHNALERYGLFRLSVEQMPGVDCLTS